MPNLSPEAVHELTDVVHYPGGREVDGHNAAAVAELVAAGLAETRVEHWKVLGRDVVVFLATHAGRREAQLLAAIDRAVG